MDLQYYGANCVRITTKKASIIIDDNLSNLGHKSVTKAGDIALFTGDHKAPAADVRLTIDTPGEFEISDFSIRGIAARAHMDESGKRTTMFKIICDDIRLAVIGHIYPELSDTQLEALGTIDVLIIPVGGNGYTLDAIGATKIIKKIEPKLIIPTHYEDKAIKYEVPQSPLSEAVKIIALDVRETAPKVKLKPNELSEVTQLLVLERQQ